MADQLYIAARDRWGADEQLFMVAEELGELLAVLSRYRRGRATLNQVVDELADATIMVEQAAVIVGVEPEQVAEVIRRKRLRLACRLGLTDDCAACGVAVDRATPLTFAGELLCSACRAPQGA